MDDSTQQVPPAATEPVSSPPQPAVDLEQYEHLRQQVQQAEAAFERLSPHQKRIQRLLEDPEAGELFDSALSSYERMRAERQPPVPAEFAPVYEKVSKLEKFVDKYEEREKEAAERPQREFQARYQEWQNSPVNNRFFARLMADHPELKPRDLQYLAQVAVEANFEPLEATWKKESWRFERQGTSAPPTSQRADAGDVGIPGGKPAAATGGPTMRERIIELERARRGLTA